MYGWNGLFLRVNLTKMKAIAKKYNANIAKNFLGGSAREFGLDTISLGNVLGFAKEASEKGLIEEKVPWDKLKATNALVEDIAYRRGLSDMLAEGVCFAAEKIGGNSSK